MKKRTGLIFLVLFAVLCFGNESLAWEGRMSGMGAPIGLISDESDFLVHPAKIADGNGSNYYLNYKFDYVQVPKWNNIFNYNPAVPVFAGSASTSTQYPYLAKGSERDHDASLGGTWAFGPGRLGIFINYASRDGSFAGNDIHGAAASAQDTFSFDTDSTAYDIRLIYGLPLGAFKLGTELSFAHKTEKNSTLQTLGGLEVITNDPIGFRDAQGNTFPFVLPADLRWNEAALKLSAEAAAGPGVLTFTPRIYTVFHGTSQIGNQFAIGTFLIDDVSGNSTINGWGGGADLWYRLKLNASTSLPFLASVNYDRKSFAVPAFDLGAPMDIDSAYKDFIFTTGGGIDKDLPGQAKVASGLYYSYIQTKKMYKYNFPQSGNYYVASNETPLEKENRITLKIAGEQLISPQITARAGIDAFYGWVKDRYDFSNTQSGFSLEGLDLSTSGHRWGLSGGAGATIRIAKMSVEPFVTAGIQKTDLDKSSGTFTIFSTPFSVSLNSEKSEWSVGGGVSVKY